MAESLSFHSSQHTTLNAPIINCIIKELLNLLISTKALCDTEKNERICVIFSGTGSDMGREQRWGEQRWQIILLFNLPWKSRRYHDNKTFCLLSLPNGIDQTMFLCFVTHGVVWVRDIVSQIYLCCEGGRSSVAKEEFLQQFICFF